MAPKKNAEEIFNKAVELSDPAEQAEYLDQACAGDEKLRTQVEALLRWHTEAGDFLEEPAAGPNVTLETPTVDAAGTVIGRYKLLERIGEGGMATVYMAEQKRPIRRRVALKVIKLGMDTKQVIGRFEAERQALAMMDHPNIAKVLDAGTTENGRPYFVMELVKGVSITEFCDTNHLTPRERLSLFVSVCQAVQHAHQKGIIHRDIKPTNIMVTLHDGEPVIKVIDFGIAKAVNQQLTEKTVFTRYSQMIGTPEYMSPEQAEMSGLDVDTRTDVFSLGVLLYELLTGTTPFDSEYLLSKGYAELQRIIREEEPVRPSTKISTMGEALTDIAKHRRTKPELLHKLIRTDLDWIVMRTLEKDRSRRYQTPHDLAEDLQRHLNHEPVLAGPPSRIYRLRKLLIRHRTKVVAVAAATILIAAVIVVSTMYIQSAGREREAESLGHREVLSKAQEYRSNGQFQEALAEVTAVFDSKHVGPEARLLNARLVMELKGPSEALEELQHLLSERDDIACQAHFLLARAYMESISDDVNTAQEYRHQAKEHQQRGEELFLESAEAYFNRAMLTGTVNRTLEYLNKALDLDSGHYPSRKARALTYYAIGDYRNMERDAVAMRTMRPWDALGHSLMAISLREAGDYVEALQYHDKAIKMSPQKPDFYDQRHLTRMRMGNYKQALSDARICIRLDRDEGKYHFHSFCALVALGRYDEAKAKYESVVESNLMARWEFTVRSVKHVADTLNAGLQWHPPGPGPRGTSVFAAMQDWAETSQRLAKKARRVVPEGFHPTWSPDGTELAYSRGRVGFSGIEIKNLKSGKTRLLTVPGLDPAWSPDGRYIAFARDHRKLLVTELTEERPGENLPFITRELWLIRADGTEEPRRLAAGYWPSWSNDSKQIFYRSQRDEMLYSIAVHEGARPKPLLRCTAAHPVVSPDGRYVVYPGSESRIVELSTNSVVADYSMPPFAGGGQANWSPDGRELSIGGEGLWIYDFDTKTASNVLTGMFTWCSWSRSDTKQLAIAAQSVYGQHHEIWVASLDPNTTTAQALGPGRTMEEHCQEEIDWCTRLIDLDPGDLGNYLFRAACYVCVEDYDKAASDVEEVAVRLRGDSRSTFGWWMGGFVTDLIEWSMDRYEAGAYEQALAIFSGVDRLRRACDIDPNLAEVAHIAMSLHSLGRSKEAKATLDELRKLYDNGQGTVPVKWLCRAEKTLADESSDTAQLWEWIELGKLDDAQQRLEELQKRMPHQRADIARAARFLAMTYYERGNTSKLNGDGYGEAISAYRTAVLIDPNCARAFRDLAWLQATCPETRFRDEKTAIENALKACESTGWKEHRYVGVLAAVYAEAGDSENAVKWQKKAIDLLTDEEGASWQAVHKSRLKLYQSHKTYPGGNPWNLSTGSVVACWDFEQAVDGYVPDSSGNGHLGELQGDASIVVDAQRGNVLRLGGGGYVDCGTGSAFDITGSITLSCWVRVDQFTKHWQDLITKGDSSWRLVRTFDTGAMCSSCTGLDVQSGPYASTIVGKREVDDGDWHHVAVVYDGSQMYLFVDGRLDISVGASGNIRINDEPVYIGGNSEKPNRKWNGLIDDVRIYDYALTEAEIKKLHDESRVAFGEN